MDIDLEELCFGCIGIGILILCIAVSIKILF